ncbi:hypothetical protein MNEG_10969 [Monoraphidium neglectum]|uniref:OBG-type G domain-containing protein n=1 Tax=Monoraphidium neglectum TaxID=145388 RepID=A0A0D2M022_9CHLO|nr:hypothetical protein MNEG_10969 [Monoraphidium neglectum]KIY96994.1 hypothetical protein MNEG_10969 [Monoraphidium neglectum]|eukprot:XP_013896014.1 hypothetical protein MNEG_10969 [Monoraphidium neglectum]
MAQPVKPAKKRVGMLQAVPVVAPPDEQLRSAVKRAGRVAPSAAIKNEAEKERNRAARQLDTLMKELSVPLTRYLSAFPKAAALHPFEAALLDLTVGRGTYQSVLGKVRLSVVAAHGAAAASARRRRAAAALRLRAGLRAGRGVDSLRKAVQEVGKAYANKAAKAGSKREAAAAAEEGAEMMQKVFSRGARYVEDLKRVSKQLRSLPYVEPQLPTLALVGAPNVGKSSLVQVLSSGTPEVCDYPFTTRSIKMGHFWVDTRQHQVFDRL